MSSIERTGGVSDKDPVAMELVYTALAVYPDLEQARAYVASMGYPAITTAKLKVFRDGTGSTGREAFLKRREELAPKLEAMLADDMLDEARRATQVTSMAIDLVQQQIEDGRCADPSRVARDLSQIRSQAVDKRLALQGRPTQIVESRNVDELVRALEGMGVAKQVELDVPDAEVVDA